MVHVAPDTVTMQAGDSMYFVAMDSLTDGSSSPASVEWSSTGGTVTTEGLFRAPTAAGSYHVIAKGPNSVDSALVVVATDVEPSISMAVSTSYWIEITPASVSLPVGGSAQFTAAWKTSTGGTYTFRQVWKATAGTISSTGAYRAPSTAGTYFVIVNREGDITADTAKVVVGGGDGSGGLVGTEDYKRSGFWIEVLPSTLKLAPGAGQQFTAVGRTVDGKTYTVNVTWRANGGTISSSGYYKAPSTNGTYRVSAQRLGDVQTDTTVVTVGSTTSTTSPTLSSVVLTPATATLAIGAKQQFAAAGRMSDGSTSSVSVTYAATGGSITSGGLYTAGSTAGTYRVIAVQQGGTKADTSAITVTATATAPAPAPAPSGGTPDPSLLPAATGQAAVSASTYTALPYYSASGTQLGTNPRNMPVGSYYVDPATGVKVVRLTSPTAPYSSSGTWMSGVDYAEGGLRVGRPSGTSYPIPVVSVGSGGGQGFRLITFDLSNYAVGLRGSLPGGSAEIARAMSYVTPNVMYTIDGGVLRKWNVAGSTAVEIVSAPFPKDLRGHLHGQSTFTWFQGSDDDRWFSMMAGFSGPYLVGFDAQTNTVTEKSVSGIDEPKMDRDGRYVWARGSTPYVWDMQANTLASVSGSQPSYDGHGGVTRGYAFGNPNDGRAGWSINLKSATPSYQYLGAAFNLDNMYLQGGWVDQAAGGTTAQWVALGYQTGGGGEPGPMKYRYGALGLYKLDGSDHRLLANAYNSGNVNGTPDYYANTLWPNLAPDGKFLLFKSNQLVAAGFSSLFAAIVPGR